jgi:hypothetical protein
MEPVITSIESHGSSPRPSAAQAAAGPAAAKQTSTELTSTEQTSAEQTSAEQPPSEPTSAGRPAAGTPEGSGRTRASRRLGNRSRADRWLQPITLLWLIAALPPLLMVRRIHESTKLNYQDYWSSMLRFTNADGSLHLRGLFSYQNEHPFFVPQLVYYLDARLLTGTNHALGYFSLLVSVAAVVILWFLLPRSWSPLNRGLLLVAASAVLFCPSGVWNYVRGMSGVAWLTANLLALLGIVLASRGRTVLAVIAAAFALLTYGTGFGAPVALIVIALLRKDRRWRWLLPLGLLLGAMAVYAKTSQGGTAGGHGHDPGLLLQTFLTNLATLWDPSAGSLGLLISAAGLVLMLACAIRYWAIRDQLADLVPWWGVLAYSLTASVLISLGRSTAFGGNGAQSRYVSLSALFWFALAVVALRTVRSPRELGTRALAVVAAVLVFWGASPVLFSPAVGQSALQDEAAAGLRFNAWDPFGGLVQDPPAQITRLQSLHNYPYSSGYTVGCGVKPFATIDMSKVRTMPAAAFPTFGQLDSDKIIGSTRQLQGWIYRQYHPTQCALLVDSSGKVVGGGSAKMPRPDVAAIATSYPSDAGYALVTPASNTNVQLVVGFDDGFWKLPPTAIGQGVITTAISGG